MSEARVNITKSKDIRKPTYYVDALLNEFSEFAFDETRAVDFRSVWRSHIFKVDEKTPIDVEIGTGTGYFFAYQSNKEPLRKLIGVELKFKPLIQSIRRVILQGSKNARIVRFNASYLERLFADEEINNIYIHHPDPWSKRKKHKHRLINLNFLNKLFRLQKNNSFVDFKTDSRDYFVWASSEFKNSRYTITRYSEDLHNSEWGAENFITQFERYFIQDGQPIYYLRAEKK